MEKILLMRDLLKSPSAEHGDHRNPMITRGIAAELRAKGYEIKVRRVNGKSTNVWVKGARTPVDAKALVAKAIAKQK